MLLVAAGLRNGHGYFRNDLEVVCVDLREKWRP